MIERESPGGQEVGGSNPLSPIGIRDARGLVNDKWFGRDVADRLLHVVVALSMPEVANRSKQDPGDRKGEAA